MIQGHLEISQVRNSPTDPPAASGLTWAIKTLSPQIQQAELELSCMLGLKPGKPDAAYALSEVQNIEVVKQMLTAVLLARVLGAIYMRVPKRLCVSRKRRKGCGMKSRRKGCLQW